MRRLLALLLTGVAVSATTSPVMAQSALVGTETTNVTAPLWEAGVLAAGGYVAHYPASSQGQLRGLPIPYLIYRGDTVRIGDNGIIRARKEFADDQLELDIGMDGAFDVDSQDNNARRGMPDLDLLIEAGPEVTWHFKHKTNPLQVDLSLEVRAMISAELVSFGYEGITVNPQISMFDHAFLGTDLRAYASIGPVFGYDGVNEYFYQVDGAYATPDRPAYSAKSGYIGTETTLGLAYPIHERLLVFTAAQIGYYGGAANQDSPLHRDDMNINFGVGLRWSFWQSETRVPVFD